MAASLHACCARLAHLDLSQNRLSALPRFIGGCTSLVELLLGYNGLEALPDELGALAALRTLDLRGNRWAGLRSAGCGTPTSLPPGCQCAAQAR